MSSEVSSEKRTDELPISTPEVEFALVLSRMIDAVSRDPDHLRQTVYELARYKLQEQCTGELIDRASQLRALEVAIQGVEIFARRNGAQIALSPAKKSVANAAHISTPLSGTEGSSFAPTATVLEARAVSLRSNVDHRAGWASPVWRLVMVLAIGFGVIVAAEPTRLVDYFLAHRVPPPAKQNSESLAAIAPPVPVANLQQSMSGPASLVPKSYGIYAVSGEKLYELEQLPGRAPDMRVAISPLITTSSRTNIADGRLKFIVYRRDSAFSAADRAEVRVVAKIERELNFDKSGKPVSSKVADQGWVMRNIAVPFRVAPYEGQPDMYEIDNGDASAALSPGRYALVLKRQAYDFTVGGEIVDPRQCLERMAATNGQFYSQCERK